MRQSLQGKRLSGLCQREELVYLRDREYAQGDIVETLITCEDGELISLKLDTTLPAYYSRKLTVRGTWGLYEQSPNMVLLEGQPHGVEGPAETYRMYPDNAKQYYDKYPPEIKEAGRGGMDCFEFAAFCDCLRSGMEGGFLFDRAVYRTGWCKCGDPGLYKRGLSQQKTPLCSG